ncbi:diphosphomevalonate decarboxylase [Companilactobacillus sp. RD055328]|uniref:diphosphomevalonate decarboxylase n=1 Tax=Companilactobacillus sp. RD055328 TaxID=2916634 RepID=UPI001FC7E724|nr:diphosphomevalonate decarboxylase [Companilactobacillus sp. RD055328]GKQ42677.1 diphosphomevalonate decarboxylase [Companilactobacillus sp. RD055328]
MNKVTAIAHTNIALIKYWGKKDEALRLPYTDSLSLTLDDFYTETSVTVSDEDQFFLDGELKSNADSQRVFNFLNYFRLKYNVKNSFLIESNNHVPNSAGLASSSSAFAALSGALAKASNLDLSLKELSQLARVGSGSASRSIYGGFVQWHAGHDDESSFAEQFDDASNSDINILSVIVNKNKKNISSTEGMNRTRMTSPFYKIWPDVVEHDLIKIKPAIKNNDIRTIGEISEHNAMEMHALTMSANPPFTYFDPETIEIMNIISNMRNENISVYFTIDAGPNVKVICHKKDVTLIKEKLEQQLANARIIITKPGPGITYK